MRICKKVKGMYNNIGTCSTNIIFSERKSRDITTTKAHLYTICWHTHSMFVCCTISGNTKAFFEVNSIKESHKAYG